MTHDQLNKALQVAVAKAPGMTADQFKAWRSRLGYNATQAAKALGCHRNAIANWEAGKHTIPKYIELACLYLATDWRR